MIKIIIRKLLLTVLILVVSAAYGKLNLDENFFSNMPDLSTKDGLMRMPTPEEMESIEQLLSTLTDDELKELVDYGTQVMKIAEDNNIPLFAPEETPATKDKSLSSHQAQTPKAPTTSAATEKVDQPKATKQDISSYRETIDELLRIIQAIRQRAQSIKKFHGIFDSLNEQLDTLVYYLYCIRKDTIIQHCAEKKYSSLITVMQDNTIKLEKLNKSLIVPTLEEIHQIPLANSVKKTLKNAYSVLTNIKTVFENMFTNDGIITKIETLLKEYEPSALKIKKANEDKEKAAFESIKKIPVTTSTTKQIPQSPLFNQPYQGPRPINTAVPFKAPAGQTPQQQAPALQKPKVVEPVKKDKTPKNKKISLADLEKEILETFDKIEQSMVSHAGNVASFLVTYDQNKNEPEVVQSALDEANFGLKKVYALAEEWHKKLEKESTSKLEMERKAKGLRDAFTSKQRHNNLKSVHAKIKSMGKKELGGSVKKFKDWMDKIEKKVSEIF